MTEKFLNLSKKLGKSIKLYTKRKFWKKLIYYWYQYLPISSIN